MYTTESKSNGTRTRLLDGAVECLRRKGYAETTARDVAEAAGANLRSIGYHFGSTKALLLAAISLNFRNWLQPLIDASGEGARSPEERLRAGMERFVEELAGNGPVLRAWLEAVALAGHEEALRSTLAKNQREFRHRLEQSLRGGEAPRPVESAAAIVTICDGIIIRFLLHGEVARPREVAQLVGKVFGD